MLLHRIAKTEAGDVEGVKELLGILIEEAEKSNCKPRYVLFWCRNNAVSNSSVFILYLEPMPKQEMS